MAIEHAIWKIDATPIRVQESRLADEAELEAMIAADISILDSRWLLIGRQVWTDYNKFIDLLAMDANGSLIIIELKKSLTPREVVAQSLDYASWIKELDASRIAEVFEKYGGKVGKIHASLDQAFAAKFASPLSEDMLTGAHQIVIVASQLDASTERIVRYLNDSQVAINVVFFKVFQDGENRYLSRAWFFDPVDTQERATIAKGSEPWNGEFYVSFGDAASRSWKDAHKYGFISAGGGRWYSKTLNMLQPGNRVWVNIPKTGYVGVGIVRESAVKVDQFMVGTESGPIPILQADIHANYHRENINDEDTAEYLVRVEWINAVPAAQAKWEVGFFGNQNTVARPTTPSWRHTVERLSDLFSVSQ